MTDITIIEQTEGMPNLPAVVIKHQHDNPLVVALQGHLIRESKDIHLAAVLSACIEKARFDLQLRSDSVSIEDNEKFIDSVLADIRLFWYTLTLEQIPFVFYHGVRGKYDEGGKVFLTPVNISRWFAQFTMSAERVEANKILVKLNQPPPPPPPTPEEVEAKRRAFIVEAFEKYKATVTFNDYRNLVWDAIEHYRVIPFDDDTKRRIAAKAKQDLVARLTSPGGGLRQTRTEEALLKAIQNGGGKEEIKAGARKLALLEFFKSLAELDESINDWLNDTAE